MMDIVSKRNMTKEMLSIAEQCMAPNLDDRSSIAEVVSALFTAVRSMPPSVLTKRCKCFARRCLYVTLTMSR